MNIYWRELRINRRSLVIWVITLAALGVLVMALFPSIAKEAQNFGELLAVMPQGLIAAFGLEKISMTDILGYYATKQVISVSLFGSIYAIMLGAGMLSKEVNDRTIEFLLSKPVSRSEVITAKLCSVVTLIVLFDLLISAIMFAVMETVKIEDFSINLFVILSAAVMLLHLTFASLGFLIAVADPHTRSVVPFSLGLVLVTYFLSIAAALSDKLDFLKYFSPFKYVDAADIIVAGRIEPAYLVLMALINGTAVILTFVLYRRKDIMA